MHVSARSFTPSLVRTYVRFSEGLYVSMYAYEYASAYVCTFDVSGFRDEGGEKALYRNTPNVVCKNGVGPGSLR